MVTFNGLPLYRVALSQEDGVVRVSLVDDPAVESNFEYFNKDKAPALYAVQDDEKRIVRGVVLRADYPIYRNDGKGGYYVTFGKEVVRQAAERFLTEGHANDVDLQHDGNDVEGVQLVQLFIKDSGAGIDPAGFSEIADGSLFGEYHVTNDDIWDEIKAGTFKGFSVEIFYTLVPVQMAREDEDAAALETLLQLLSNITDMTKFSQIVAQLSAALKKPEAAQFGSVTTDKGVVYWEGDEDLKAGDAVQVEDAEGNRSGAADGDYTTSDGKVIVVVDGKVSEIRDAEAEVATDTDDTPAEDNPERMARQRAEKFAASYTEKMRKIHEAIVATIDGFGDSVFGYLVDAGDDWAVFDSYGEFNGWGDTYTRYKVSWNGDEPSVSDPVEVRYAFVPMDYDDAAAFNSDSPEVPTEDEFNAAVQVAEQFKAENEALKARLAELEKTPAGKPVQDAFKGEGVDEGPVVGGLVINDKGLARLARLKNK